MSSCLWTAWRIVSYTHQPIFESDDIFYEVEVSPWEYILLNESVYNFLSNFPLKLEKYTELNYSSQYCINEIPKESLIALWDFSLQDVWVMSINVLLILSPLILLALIDIFIIQKYKK